MNPLFYQGGHGAYNCLNQPNISKDIPLSLIGYSLLSTTLPHLCHGVIDPTLHRFWGKGCNYNMLKSVIGNFRHMLYINDHLGKKSNLVSVIWGPWFSTLGYKCSM